MRLCLQTVFVALLAYIFLSERLHLYLLADAGFILTGVLLVMLLNRGPATPNRALTDCLETDNNDLLPE